MKPGIKICFVRRHEIDIRDELLSFYGISICIGSTHYQISKWICQWYLISTEIFVKPTNFFKFFYWKFLSGTCIKIKSTECCLYSRFYSTYLSIYCCLGSKTSSLFAISIEIFFWRDSIKLITVALNSRYIWIFTKLLENVIKIVYILLENCLKYDQNCWKIHKNSRTICYIA